MRTPPRTLMLAAAAAIFAPALAACGSEAEPSIASTLDPAEAEKAVREANARYDRALAASDRAALEELLAPDYVYITAQGRVHDRAATIASHVSGETQVESQGSDEVQVRWLGDAALVTGRFRARVTAGGTTYPIEERYTALWSQDDGRWRLRHEHASEVPRAPVPPAAP